jgi:hypothetical protein
VAVVWRRAGPWPYSQLGLRPAVHQGRLAVLATREDRRSRPGGAHQAQAEPDL